MATPLTLPAHVPQAKALIELGVVDHLPRAGHRTNPITRLLDHILIPEQNLQVMQVLDHLEGHQLDVKHLRQIPNSKA